MTPDGQADGITIGTWQPPFAAGGVAEEMLVSIDQNRPLRIMVLPAWFDEANRMRRFSIEVMRRLDSLGIDSVLPDLPGCNESLAPLDEQTIANWRVAAEAACESLKASHVLTIRAGAIVAPPLLPGWRYTPQTGAKLLRGLIRARIIASREEGVAEKGEALMAKGRTDGLVLAGWPIGKAMFAELEQADAPASEVQREIAQSEIGGAGLWLRAEPGEDADQASALAGIIASEIGAGN